MFMEIWFTEELSSALGVKTNWEVTLQLSPIKPTASRLHLWKHQLRYVPGALRYLIEPDEAFFSPQTNGASFNGYAGWPYAFPYGQQVQPEKQKPAPSLTPAQLSYYSKYYNIPSSNGVSA
jgi:hypothetical protein